MTAEIIQCQTDVAVILLQVGAGNVWSSQAEIAELKKEGACA